MAGLLDFIFDNINTKELDRSGVLAYTTYIAEIYHQNLSIDQMFKYQEVNIQLLERLLELDRERVKEGRQPSRNDFSSVS